MKLNQRPDIPLHSLDCRTIWRSGSPAPPSPRPSKPLFRPRLAGLPPAPASQRNAAPAAPAAQANVARSRSSFFIATLEHSSNSCSTEPKLEPSQRGLYSVLLSPYDSAPQWRPPAAMPMEPGYLRFPDGTDHILYRTLDSLTNFLCQPSSEGFGFWGFVDAAAAAAAMRPRGRRRAIRARGRRRPGRSGSPGGGSASTAR